MKTFVNWWKCNINSQENFRLYAYPLSVPTKSQKRYNSAKFVKVANVNINGIQVYTVCTQDTHTVCMSVDILIRYTNTHS